MFLWSLISKYLQVSSMVGFTLGRTDPPFFGNYQQQVDHLRDICSLIPLILGNLYLIMQGQMAFSMELSKFSLSSVIGSKSTL